MNKVFLVRIHKLDREKNAAIEQLISGYEMHYPEYSVAVISKSVNDVQLSVESEIRLCGKNCKLSYIFVEGYKEFSSDFSMKYDLDSVKQVDSKDDFMKCFTKEAVEDPAVKYIHKRKYMIESITEIHFDDAQISKIIRRINKMSIDRVMETFYEEENIDYIQFESFDSKVMINNRLKYNSDLDIYIRKKQKFILNKLKKIFNEDVDSIFYCIFSTNDKLQDFKVEEISDEIDEILGYKCVHLEHKLISKGSRSDGKLLDYKTGVVSIIERVRTLYFKKIMSFMSRYPKLNAMVCENSNIIRIIIMNHKLNNFIGVKIDKPERDVKPALQLISEYYFDGGE